MEKPEILLRLSLIYDQVRHRRLEHEKDKMLSNGWCHHKVRHLAETYSLDTFSYLASLERSPHRLADHTRCAGHPACIAYNTNPATYKTRHTTERCACPTVFTPYHDLISILRQGEIPLISIETKGPDTDRVYELKAHRRSKYSNYIAISHVWADGLGNPNGNGLPLCQIKRLSATLDILGGLLKKRERAFGRFRDVSPSLLWMDTLCIPVAEHDKSLRLIQIDKMASIYKGATCSLVLDCELMAVTLGLTPGPERRLPYHIRKQEDGSYEFEKGLEIGVIARIASSVWMSRSWTYQEGKLPESIAVQFRDGVVLSKDRWKARLLAPPGSSQNQFHTQNLQDRCTEATALRTLPVILEESQNSRLSPSDCECISRELEDAFGTTFKDEVHDFVAVWNELTGRSTTMPKDVPIVISNILDLENRNILKYHTSSEMFQAIMLSLKRLPLSIFFNFGPRHEPDGNHQNRWVPAQVGTDRLIPDDSLEVYSSHLLYRFIPQDVRPKFSIYTTDQVGPSESATNLYFRIGGICYIAARPNMDADQLQRGSYTSTCVIIENTGSQEGLETKRGACFSFRNVNNGFQHVHEFSIIYDCPIRIQPVPTSSLSTLHQQHVHTLTPITHACEFKIKYDPLPDFKPLRRRKWPDVESYHDRGAWIGGILPALIYLAVSFGTPALFAYCWDRNINWGGKGTIGWIVGMGIFLMIFFAGAAIRLAFSMVQVPMWLGGLYGRASIWRHIRALEAIAGERPRDNIV